MNLANLVAHCAEFFPNHTALSLGHMPYATYAELNRHIRAISHHLRVHHRMTPGSRIALVMRNSPAFWEVLFGAWHAGMIVVPINPRLHANEIKFILANSGAGLCFVTPELAPKLVVLSERNGGGTQVIVCGTSEYDTIRSAESPDTAAFPAQPEDIAWLFYTSGTTGRPKGAMLSHNNLMMMVMAHFIDLDDLGAMDCIVHAAPLSHGSGLLGLTHFAVGANNIVPASGGFDAAEIAGLLDHYTGATIFASPTMVNRMAASPEFTPNRVASLRTIVYGGAPMYLADLRRAITAFGPRLTQIYGQGESPMTITGLARRFHRDEGQSRFNQRLMSVGVARWGVELQIVDSMGRPQETGVIGEVAVRGDVVMGGYWNDPEATAQALRDGWLHTGDIGVLDDEGFLTLLDRNKDLIISGGSNIYPREIEETLLQHPEITEVSVVGRPDPEWGEEVVAFVVPQRDDTPSMTELDDWCLSHIARFKRPRTYIFLKALPKNSTGKVLKSELRELARHI